ncbi:alpha/beta hydrolase [Anaerosporobacter sp.]|uniref:alpha/beta hydrolase n=1 Tax=Anaerosporobacter sp. TaxID=1872529 RepID=UPI00286F1A60|nr:alpha/beta hydrolase [Anaerosporobacter sp.]
MMIKVLVGIIVCILVAIMLVEIKFFRYAIYRYGIKMPDGDDVFTGSRKKYEDAFREGKAWIDSKNPEQVSIVSNDGLRLHGSLIQVKHPKRTVLCVHGFRGMGEADFGVICDFYYEQGCNLLIIDQRAHGSSEGKYITFGTKERYDVVEWITFLNERFGEELPIVLDGVSMGASTVLMASGFDLPDNVRGIIADCGFTSPKAIYTHVAKEYYRLPAFPLIPIFGLVCRIVAGFNISEACTKKALAKNTRPILFVHGEDDRFVPPYMSEENYDVCNAECYMQKVAGAKHAQSYLANTEQCQESITEFFEVIME